MSWAKSWCVQVGVDINRVAHNTWQAAPLQFVAGLGPRKAQALLRTVQREQHMTTRLDMWQEFGVLDKKVFKCALCGTLLRLS